MTLMQQTPGLPDDSPEWTDEMQLWSVCAGDFESLEEVHAFLRRRSAFLRAAEAAGIPRETFLPFDPSKPGFEERAKALIALPKAVGWTAE